jgi:ubiquinone/menaquinone biosynthesis C-methylase UbiE
MSVRRTIFAATYDRQTRTMERGRLRERRHGLVAHAARRVLEVGAGTGANLQHYGSAATSLTMTEPDAAMLKRLDRLARRDYPTTTVLRAPAEDLPFDDASLDVVVSTLVLCGVDDQPRVVREIRRVLRPRGRLLLIEHVRATDPKASRRQDRLNWLNRLVVCCDCNRPTLQTLMHGGFDVATIVAAELPNYPPFVRPAITGVAYAPASVTAHSAPATVHHR